MNTASRNNPFVKNYIEKQFWKGFIGQFINKEVKLLVSPLRVPAVFQMVTCTLLIVCLCQPVWHKDNLSPCTFIQKPSLCLHAGNNCQSPVGETVIKLRKNECPIIIIIIRLTHFYKQRGVKTTNVDEMELSIYWSY